MKTLAIDTANQVMGVALFQEKQIIGEHMTNLKKNHSVRLMPAVHQLMEDTAVSPEDLEKIVVSKGPGSYTGVRIGLSTAKSLAWALDIPIVGVSSLEVLAYQGRFFPGAICPFFDARRGNVFTGLYQWEEGDMLLTGEEQNIHMEDWLHQLSESLQTVLFLSPDIDQHREKIETIMGYRAVIPDEGSYHVANPSHLVMASMSKESDDTYSLTPNYLRLAEAEAKWLHSRKRSES